MLRKKIYEEIVQSFSDSYFWLGTQFSKEFLLSAASHSLQKHTNPPFRIRRHLLLYWAAAWTKCLNENSYVFTIDGLYTAKDADTPYSINLETGNTLIPNPVTKRKVGMKKTKIITVKNGYSIEVGLEHPMLVINNKLEFKWKKAINLKKNDYLVMLCRNVSSEWGYEKPIPLIEQSCKTNSKQYCFPEYTSYRLGKFLGLIIGDGSYNNNKSIQFSNINESLKEEFEELTSFLFNCHVGKTSKGSRFSSVNICKFLQESVGLKKATSRHKKIPELIMSAGPETLKGVIEGLYESDGSIDKGRILFNSTSKELIVQIQTILLSFGVVTTKKKSTIAETICVSHLENISRFMEIFDIKKHRKKILNMKVDNHQLSIPYARKTLANGLLKKAKKEGVSRRALERFYRIRHSEICSKRGISKRKFKEYCELIGFDYSHVWNDNIFFSKVKHIKSSESICYDFDVGGNHSFVANGFVTHNSSLLYKGYELLGEGLCTTMTDISNAALRGTVEAGTFITPYTLKRPFSICTEFGQIVNAGESSDLVQKLLNVLEEGIVEVSLGKISHLTPSQREDAEKDHNIYFVDRNTFRYKTDWILMAATYNKRFLVDNALESRFNIVYPEQKLDSSLTRHIVNSGGFKLDEDIVYAFRKELLKKQEINTRIKLPDEVYEKYIVTPRDCGNVLSWILCRSWWNLKTSKDDILDKFESMQRSRVEVWKTSEDRVFDCIEMEAKTVNEIVKDITLSKKSIYTALARLKRDGTVSPVIRGDGTKAWKVM